MCRLVFVACSYVWITVLSVSVCEGITPAVVDLYPDDASSMVEILGKHGNMHGGKPVNALVLFHLDACFFCEVELGTMIYNFAHDNIFNLTGVQPYMLLMNYEGKPVPGHAYCQSDQKCADQAMAVLDVNVSGITAFPTAFFYDASGVVRAQVGNSPCGIAVRRDSDSDCSRTKVSSCAAAQEDMNNWVCNLHEPGSKITTCADSQDTSWHRCRTTLPSVFV